ncbi:MAG: 4-hydroxy-tetrahydrodipicolinate synthase [Deltaproteobacteria bacterium]|nr:4-hydroxy-tetrahydrodipicolinate synthase [Deltaproteobacteria bacterium]
MTKPFHIEGAFTALVTPFAADSESIDFDAFDRLVRDQLQGGIHGLVPCGTTGESPTLSDDEQLEVIRHTVQIAAGRVPVVAGASSNCTHKTVKLAQRALEAGANAVMVVMPYYNKPTQEGLLAHVTTVAKQVGGAPVVLYNIPGRSVVDLSNDTLARAIEACPNICVIKDATGNVLRCQAMVRRFGSALSVMCGDDALTLPMMAVGAKGVISVTSNVLPAAVAEVCNLMHEGRWNEARAAHFRLVPVHDAMFVESNPGPAKATLAHLGKMKLALRLPLVAPSAASRDVVVSAVTRYNEGKP